MDFNTIKSLAWTFGPFLASYAYSQYRSLRAQSQTNRPARRPLPSHLSFPLNLLLVGFIFNLTLSLPYFAPENIFDVTSSRLQTPSDVLWRRVVALRPDGQLTQRDDLLRSKLNTMDGRCLYLTFGPEVLSDCPFCHPDHARSYLIYLLPSLLMPHFANIAALGFSTSSLATRKEGSRWRMQATLTAFVFAVADIYLFYAYDVKRNARAKRAEDLFVFFWRMRQLRHIGIALIQAGFGTLLWLSATNRLFVTPIAATERVDRIAQQLQTAAGKTSAVGIVSNAVAQNAQLRHAHDNHWQRESLVMREVMADEQVQQAVRAARSSGRINMERIDRDARTYASGFVAAS